MPFKRPSETLARYKADIESEFDIPVIMANSKKDAVAQADILITTTRGKGSVVEGGSVKPAPISWPSAPISKASRNWSSEIFKGAKVVVDSIAQCIEKGETQHPSTRK